MSEDGFKLQVSYSTPPVAQYAKGNMLNIRADTVAELGALLDEAKGAPGLAEFFSAPAVVGVETGSGDAVDTDTAQELVTKHLGADQVEPASQAQVQYLVNLGVSAGEARGLSKKDASARIKALKESK